jgi:hypothetical protein
MLSDRRLCRGAARATVPHEPCSRLQPERRWRFLWWPPGKIAGRYLSPYLAHLGRHESELPAFEDRELPDGAEPVDAADHEAAVDLALMMADDEARSGSPGRALEWLAAAEGLNAVLRPSTSQSAGGGSW